MTELMLALDEGDPLLGRVIDARYQIVRQIGRGGVGVVYLARDRDEHRDVVVKFLSEGLLSDADAVARFRREAEKLSETRHPNIVSMLGLGQDERRIYLVMEYVRGVLLHQFVAARGGRLCLNDFVPIAAQILKGMGHAHSREMMLRDIKPSNIMLCERKGRANFVKILDFGLAKQLREEVQITGEHVMGTAGYLAPEAVRGETLDLRVDVYAVGVLFFFMLSGRLPFEASSTASVFYKTVHDPAPNLADLLPEGHGVPEGLLQLVSDCLEKDPDQRPPDANAIVERLIDSVSAALFRLPIAQTGAAIPASYGNTGMFSLIGKSASVAGASTSAELPPLRWGRWVAAAVGVMLLGAGAGFGLSQLGDDEAPAVATEFATPTIPVAEVAPAQPAAQAEVPAPVPPPAPVPASAPVPVPEEASASVSELPRARRARRGRARQRSAVAASTLVPSEKAPEPLVEPAAEPEKPAALAEPKPAREPAPSVDDGLLRADRRRESDGLLPTRKD